LIILDEVNAKFSCLPTFFFCNNTRFALLNGCCNTTAKLSFYPATSTSKLNVQKFYNIFTVKVPNFGPHGNFGPFLQDP
jgi:hypothetical protein